MGMPVVTVASGGMPVTDVTATTGRGTPVTEATNGRGCAVTKVASGGMAVAYETLVVWPLPVTPAATFDPASVSNTALSNSNLTVTHSNTTPNAGARVAPVKSTGKYYFEATFVASTGSGDAVGLLTQAGLYSDMVSNLNCVEVTKSSNIVSNNTSSGKNIGGAFGNGTTVGVAVDLDARKAWMRNGAGNWNGLAIGSENPATGLGGVVVAPTVPFSPVVFFSAGGTAGDVFTANFGATAYVAAAPAGFLNWPTS